MTTSNFDQSLKQKTTEYFVNEYFSEDATDPENWDYEPSTYGVDGVEIVTDKHMVAFDDFNGGIDNPGRDEIDYNAVDALEACIKSKGVVTKGSRVIYYDVDTGEKINGIKRSIVGNRLGFRGWMGVGVRFKNATAKADFAYASNNPVDGDATLVHQLPTKGDTIAYVVDRFQKTGRTDISEKEISDLVEEKTKNNFHITTYNKGDIVKKVLVKLQSDNKTSERYIVYDEKEMEKELDSLVECENEWALKYWEEYDENDPTNAVLIFVNMAGNGISGSYQYIERKLALAQRKGLPACFVIAAKAPKRKNSTITSKRANILTGDIRKLEETVCEMFKHDVNVYGRILAHNHPDAQHVFLRQDSENEPEGTLIYAKDIL
tara:strand:+ start:925 stop:2055 length:1131 start_codon:yes stop_codon:yes gene_type:complete